MSEGGPWANCGICEWTLRGDDFETVKAEAYKHWETAHPKEWEDQQRAICNAHYFLTGEGEVELDRDVPAG